MRHILSKTHRPALERFASSRVLLGFDFDGTLAPIVSDPRAVRLRERTRRLLRLVARRYPCVVISGRARNDLLARLNDIPVIEVFGSHGLEPNRSAGRLTALVRPWIRSLHERLDGCRGVIIEDKGLSVAVHYRQCPDRRRARRAIMRAASSLGPGIRLLSGNLAVDLLPDAGHKGVALRRLRSRIADTAVYIGDSATDEDVFELDEPGRLLSIRVGRSRASAASYYLRRQSEVDDLLAVLADLRNGSS
jgi:trehalose 6-phosphate phosphatase